MIKLKKRLSGVAPKDCLRIKKIHELGVILQTTNASPRLAIEHFMLAL